jgi:hypothetical protein
MTSSPQTPEPLRDAETETDVAIVGDLHSNSVWALNVLPRIGTLSPGVRTVLQLGDFNVGVGRAAKGFLNLVDSLCRGQGIDRLLITPGNHDHQERNDSLTAIQRGEPAQISERVSILPRGYRFAIGGRSFLSFGGAASLDSDRRTEGVDWWPTEVASEATYVEAAAQGYADVMLTHEAVDGATLATRGIEAGKNPYGWPAHRLSASADSRRLNTDLWNAVRPRLLFHGHLHERAYGHLADGRKVYSLDRDPRHGNMGILNLESLDWAWH